MGGRTNYLVFRTFGVEDGQEELAVSVLAFGELESSKDLPERWRGSLCWVEGQHAGGQRERERAIDLLEGSPRGVDEVLGVGGRVHGWGR